MHYLHFEEYSNRLESHVNFIEIEGCGFKPQTGQKKIIFSFFLTLFMYLSDPLWKKKVFDFNYINVGRIYNYVNNCVIMSNLIAKGTSYFQNLIKLKC
jgi:hypothetical protein